MKNCPLCNSDKIKLQLEDFVGYQSEMKLYIYLCSSCETTFPSEKINANKIYDFIYKNGDNVPGYNRYWSYSNRIKSQKKPLQFLTDSEEAYWSVANELSKQQQSNNQLKILEIGCGLGYLTYALNKEGYNAIGLDISKEAIANAKEKFGDYYVCADLFEFVKEAKNSYDIIILTEVIEHLEDPIKFIETVKEMLADNGKAIVTTPNRSIAPFDIVWDSEAPPVHHWWFGEKSMRFIARTLDLNISFVSFSNYYRKKPKTYNAEKARRKKFRQPILNADWELINPKLPKKNGPVKLFFKNLYGNLYFLKSTYLQIKDSYTL